MSTALVWFRQDLRLADNPALANALRHHERVIPVYLHAPGEYGNWRTGAASNWWLHHSLSSLDKALRERGSRLVLRAGGNALDALRSLIEETGSTHVYWNRRYEPALATCDRESKAALQDRGITVQSSNASLLFEPGSINKVDGSAYRVFTPFWKSCIGRGLPDSLSEFPETMPPVDRVIASVPLQDLDLLPEKGWAAGFSGFWQPGEEGALTALQQFIDEALSEYAPMRDRPDVAGTSMLSPHMHFGELGPRQVVAAIRQAGLFYAKPEQLAGAESFLREIGWREFACHLLHQFPDTMDESLDPRFQDFPWRDDADADLAAWQKGRTGIPIVDAGMRQLWQTGWMHNRVRMITASFLVKNLCISWQAGAAWFWDTLLDADLASNTLGWQWVAGCGADAAPYFRIFNPVLQARKFDPDGVYIRKYVPEVAALPDRYVGCPWEAPEKVRDDAGFRLGRDYPPPLVDLKLSRREALDAYAQIKSDHPSDAAAGCH